MPRQPVYRLVMVAILNMFSSIASRLYLLLTSLVLSVHAAPFANTVSDLAPYPSSSSTPTYDTIPPNDRKDLWISPEYKWIFQFPLPIPSVKIPKLWVRHKSEAAQYSQGNSTYTNDTTGAIIDYYEVEVKSIKKQIYPDLPATTLFAYDGLQPGPTFIMQKGRGKY
jgi:hypothetical protein